MEQDAELARKLAAEWNPVMTESPFWLDTPVPHINPTPEEEAEMEGDFGKKLELWAEWDVNVAQLRELIHIHLPHIPPDKMRIVYKDTFSARPVSDGAYKTAQRFKDLYLQYRGETVYVEYCEDSKKPSPVCRYFQKLEAATNCFAFTSSTTTTSTTSTSSTSSGDSSSKSTTGWVYVPPKEKGVVIKKKKSKTKKDDPTTTTSTTSTTATAPTTSADAEPSKTEKEENK